MLRRSLSTPAALVHPSPVHRCLFASTSLHCFVRQRAQIHPSVTVQRQETPSPGGKLYDVDIELFWLASW